MGPTEEDDKTWDVVEVVVVRGQTRAGTLLHLVPQDPLAVAGEVKAVGRVKLRLAA